MYFIFAYLGGDTSDVCMKQREFVCTTCNNNAEVYRHLSDHCLNSQEVYVAAGISAVRSFEHGVSCAFTPDAALTMGVAAAEGVRGV